MTTRDPKTLRPHPLNRLPRWAQSSDEWRAFVDDIRANGIKVPLCITKDDLVVDGETRRQAAVALQLAAVPVMVVSDGDVAGTILRELALRRNLTKSQIAYAAVPLLEAGWKESAERHTTALQASYRHVPPQGRFAEKWAPILGVKKTFMYDAKRLHELLGEHGEKPFMGHSAEARSNMQRLGLDPEDDHTWLGYFEACIFDAEKPMSLGGALAGIGYLLDIEKWPKHRRGGVPKEDTRQLALFKHVWRDLGMRYTYWQKMERPQKDEAEVSIRSAIESMPEDLLDVIRRASTTEWRRRCDEHAAKNPIPKG